jgi:hypothetical protein
VELLPDGGQNPRIGRDHKEQSTPELLAVRQGESGTCRDQRRSAALRRGDGVAPGAGAFVCGGVREQSVAVQPPASPNRERPLAVSFQHCTLDQQLCHRRGAVSSKMGMDAYLAYPCAVIRRAFSLFVTNA